MNDRAARRAAAAAVTLVTSAAVLAGCGHQVFGAQAGRAGAAAYGAALSVSSGCAQAAPVTERALGTLQRLRQGTLTAAHARRLLDSWQATVGRLARTTTSDPVLQEDLVMAFDAYSAFRAVMSNPGAPAYPGTYANLAGELTGFRRTCLVVRPSFAARGNVAAAAFTGSPPVPSATSKGAVSPGTTVKGSEQIALWARADAGAPTLTLRVRELSAGSVVGSRQVTMRLGTAFRFGYLTYRVRRPGASTLSVTVSVAHLAPGRAFAVKDITITRE